MPYVQVGENDLLQRRVYLHLVDGTDGITAKTGQTGTCKVSINGNPPTTSINSLVEIDSSNLPGDYYLLLDPTEIKTLGTAMVRFKNSNTAEFVTVVDILAFNPRLPISLQPGFNSVAGPDIDYKRIARIITDALNLLPEPKEPIEPKEPDLTPLVSAIHDVITEIRAIEMPEAKEADLTPVMAKLSVLEAAIKAIPKTDLNPVLEEIRTQFDALEEEFDSSDNVTTDGFKQVEKSFQEVIRTVKDRPVMLNVTNAPTPEPPLKGKELLTEYLKQ